MLYMTEKGVELTLKELSPALIQRVVSEVAIRARADGEPIDVPTFQLKTVAGEIQEFQLTDKNLEPEDPDEALRRQLSWTKYQMALSELEAAQATARTKFMLTWGVDVDLPDDQRWIKMLKSGGIDVPDDEDDQRFLYLLYEVLTPLELQAVIAELNIIAFGKAVDPKEVESFREQLRDQVRRRAGTAISDALRSLLETLEESPGLGGDTAILGVDDGESVATNAD